MVPHPCRVLLLSWCSSCNFSRPFHCFIRVATSEWCGKCCARGGLWSRAHSHISFALKQVPGQLLCCVRFHGVHNQVLLKSLDSVVLAEVLWAGKAKPHPEYMSISMRMNFWSFLDGIGPIIPIASSLSLWIPFQVCGCPSYCPAEESHMNFLVMLVLLSPAHSTWPWWSVCSLSCSV